MTEKKIRILYIASEAGPFIKIGGLGDVAGTLPPILYHLGPAEVEGYQIDIRLVIPYHREVAEKYHFTEPLLTLTLPRKSGDMQMDVFESEIKGMPVYLIDGPELTESPRIYSFRPEEDMPKFAAFSLAALQLAKQLDFKPDILNANDWHTAISVYALRFLRRRDPFFQNTKSLFTVHNLPYMGAECKPLLKDLYLPVRRWANLTLPKWARSFAMPLGLLTADHINAVSPTYAREIQTPDFGCSLEEFLARRADRISGIINGLDYTAWNPATDQEIPLNFGVETLAERVKNKLALQKEFDLPQDASVPLVIVISRLDNQKGIDIAIEAFRQIKSTTWQAIILGTGQQDLEQACSDLAAELPQNVRAAIRFDGKLARRMYAGGDCILLPSRYEPCGLTQLISMRYGCVPVAHAVGGFVDTIEGDEATPATRTGYLCHQNTPEAFAQKLEQVFDDYASAEAWKKIQLNGMRKDYSWHHSAKEYFRRYLSMME